MEKQDLMLFPNKLYTLLVCKSKKEFEIHLKNLKKWAKEKIPESHVIMILFNSMVKQVDQEENILEKQKVVKTFKKELMKEI